MFSATTIKLSCPECLHQTAKTFDWLEVRDRFDCPTCGRTVSVDKGRRGQRVDGPGRQELAVLAAAVEELQQKILDLRGRL